MDVKPTALSLDPVSRDTIRTEREKQTAVIFRGCDHGRRTQSRQTCDHRKERAGEAARC